MTINPLYDISRVYLEQIAVEAFVDPEQGEAPSGRSPLQNVSDHPNPLVRKRAVKAFKKQMGKEYGGTWKSRSKDPVDEAAKPDYLDFDDDGNEKESMKKALKDKAKKKNLEEAGGRHGGGSMVGQPGGPPPRNSKTKRDVSSHGENNMSRGEARFGKKVEEAHKPGRKKDYLPGNQERIDANKNGKIDANDFKLLRAKKGKVEEGFSNWREDLKEVLDSDSQDQNLKKVEEKKGIKNKVTINPEMREAIEQLGGQLIEMVELDEKTLTSAEAKKKEEIVKSMKKKTSDFEKRYPGRGKEVMYATATKMAKKVAEQAMELQPKTQQKTQPEKPDPALVAKQKQAIALQKQIEMKKLQALSKGVPLTQSFELEGEVIDERRREDKGKPRGPEPSAAFKTVSKMMGSSRMGVKPRGVKKEKGAPTPGPARTPAQKVAKRRADAQRAQDTMSSRFD